MEESQTKAEKPSRAGRDLKAATIFGVIAGAVVAFLLYIHTLPFFLFVVLLSLYAEYELTIAFQERRISIVLLPMAVGTIGMLVSAYMLGVEAAWVAFLLTVLCVSLWRLLKGVDARAYRDVLCTTFVTAYVPLGAVFVVLMQAHRYSPALLVLWILATVANDTGGYATGVMMGKHPLAPSVSPKKTWEGFAGSVIATVVVVCIGLYLMGLNPLMGIILGLLSAVIATLGDLGESLLKRSLGVKDMGNIIPGHGGVMDRLDSLLMTAPLFFLWFFFLVG